MNFNKIVLKEIGWDFKLITAPDEIKPAGVYFGFLYSMGVCDGICHIDNYGNFYVQPSVTIGADNWLCVSILWVSN